MDDNGVTGGSPAYGPTSVSWPDRRPVRVHGVQWALWGKAATDTEYSVLSCSDGTFDESHFKGLLTRYSPGTLDQGRLPQSTISWVRDRADTSYLAIAIHELAPKNPDRARGRSRTDAVGRPIVYVRYFAVDYDKLTRDAVTYRELAAGLRDCDLPPRSAAPVTAVLPRLAQRPAAGPVLELAQRTAASLLTTRPVCVVGAGSIDADDRLWFIDTVMSLLPYGLRTSMSAATWANSTTQDHKLRLFFSDVPRPRSSDVVADWNRPDSVPVEDPDAVKYLQWLRGRPWAARRLAERTERRAFRKEDVEEIIAGLPFDADRDLTIEEALEGAGESLLGGHIEAFQQYFDHIRRKLGGQAEWDRTQCLEVIKRYALLSRQPLLSQDVRIEFRRVLLGLAFSSPLTYAGFLELAECAGVPLDRDKELLDIVLASPVTPIPWILLRLAQGVQLETLLNELTERRVDAAHLLALLDEDSRRPGPVIRPEHGRAVFDVGLQHLFRYSGGYRKELRDLGYLAPVVEHYFAADRRGQRERLFTIVRNTHGRNLDKQALSQILSGSKRMPTDALLSAVVAQTGQRRLAKVLYANARTADLDPQGADLTGWVTRPLSVVSGGGPSRRLVISGWALVAAVLIFLLVVALSPHL